MKAVAHVSALVFFNQTDKVWISTEVVSNHIAGDFIHAENIKTLLAWQDISRRFYVL